MNRTGIGYDVHRLVQGRPLIIGGVNIPFKKGLTGHSDADVLVHAIMDALLGAAALGDIGKHFPDKGADYLQANSLKLLDKVVNKLYRVGYMPHNVDSIIIAQAPKMAEYIPRMRENIAQRLRIGPDMVSVKATTTEGMGYIGASEAIAAQAVCNLVPVKTGDRDC